MAGAFKNAMTMLGLSDPAEDVEPEETHEDEPRSFDEDQSVITSSSGRASANVPAARPSTTQFRGSMNQITTIHPKTYDDAQAVGAAVREGVPVVLNLTDVPEAIAFRIVDFSAGVVFGLRGSIERVTPRVFLLSPAQVSINVEETPQSGSAHDLFAN